MLVGMKNLNGYLLGEHLGHTFSPKIHALLADYSYGIKEVEKDKLSQFMTGKDFDFLNVTIPYKKEIIQYLDYLSPEAERIGAVNTVKKTKDNKLVGYNTDYFGFEYTLKKSGISVEKAKVIVLGSGGASLPVKEVLYKNGASEIITISRNGENNYKNISKHADAEVIVNTTPVGMYPSNGDKLLDLNIFSKLRGVIDIIYNPRKTALILDAEARGIPAIDGLSMLVAQAKYASEIFTDSKIDDAEIQRITDILSFDMTNIVLIGMPGSGKTTMGNIIAKLTQKTFIDCDEEFEKKFSISPAQAIESFGEERFREMEHEVAKEVGSHTGSVIATGGGIVTKKENYAPLHQNGVIFFIERSLDMLETKGRPLSKTLGVEVIYNNRLPLYLSFCDHKISNNGTETECADKIIEFMKAGF